MFMYKNFGHTMLVFLLLYLARFSIDCGHDHIVD